MRFPTIPEMFDAAGCIAFGHQWCHIKTDRQGLKVYECTDCGEIDRRP